MSSRVDIDSLLALLREREYHSLPFIVVPPRGVSASQILDGVRAALKAADRRSEEREPGDPTSSTEGDAAPKGVAAEIVEGSMGAEEIRTYLEDLRAALDAHGLGVRVSPYPPDRRIPDFLDWLELPPQVTGLMHFTATGGETASSRRIPVTTFQRIIPALVAWTKVPVGTVVVGRGLTSTVSRADLAPGQLLEGLPLEPPELGIMQFTGVPKRLRSVQFGWEASGTLQVVDEGCRRTESLTALTQALRIVASDLDYAAVRLAQPVTGGHGDVPIALNRPFTEAEKLVRSAKNFHLLDRYAVDAYVAQVLTGAHLEKASHLDDFQVEEQGNDRYLVTALDPEPWLADVNPRPDVLARARRGFGSMLLDREVCRAHPPPWVQR